MFIVFEWRKPFKVFYPIVRSVEIFVICMKIGFVFIWIPCPQDNPVRFEIGPLAMNAQVKL